MSAVTVRVRGKRGVITLSQPSHSDHPLLDRTAQQFDAMFGSRQRDVCDVHAPDAAPPRRQAPGWWRHVEAARTESGLTLPGLPGSPDDATVKPLAAMGPLTLTALLVQAGVEREVARSVATHVTRFKKAQAYSRACAADGAVAVSLLDGSEVGPVSDHQREQARKRIGSKK